MKIPTAIKNEAPSRTTGRSTIMSVNEATEEGPESYRTRGDRVSGDVTKAAN